MTSPALKWDVGVPGATRSTAAASIRARLPTRLFHLAVRRETGVLVLRDGTRRKRIFIVEGSPSSSRPPTSASCSASTSITRGQVLRMEVEMALAMLPRFGGRIGDALVGLGVLRPIELFRAIHEQTQERLVEVFHWKKGEIAFARGVRSQEETFPLGVDTYELIGRGIRSGYGYEELEGLLQCVNEEVIEPVVAPPVRRRDVPPAGARGGRPRGRDRQDDPRQAHGPARAARGRRTPRRSTAPCSSASRASC